MKNGYMLINGISKERNQFKVFPGCEDFFDFLGKDDEIIDWIAPTEGIAFLTKLGQVYTTGRDFANNIWKRFR